MSGTNASPHRGRIADPAVGGFLDNARLTLRATGLGPVAVDMCAEQMSVNASRRQGTGVAVPLPRDYLS